MERNRWETALRCLEVALHPNTGDDEVIAGVNGFRRTAAGMPLREVYARFARSDGAAAGPAGLQHELDRLSQENLDLRRRLDAAEALRSVSGREIDEGEQRLRALDRELAATRRRAEAAERKLDEFGAAYAAVTDSLRDEIASLRGALARARHEAAQARPAPAVPMFRDFLAAAHRGAHPAATVAPPMSPPAHGRDAAASVIVGGNSRRPWTA